MSVVVRCDVCSGSMFSGNNVYCNTCYSVEVKLKRKFEVELEQKIEEIAILKEKIKKLEDRLK